MIIMDDLSASIIALSLSLVELLPYDKILTRIWAQIMLIDFRNRYAPVDKYHTNNTARLRHQSIHTILTKYSAHLEQYMPCQSTTMFLPIYATPTTLHALFNNAIPNQYMARRK